MATGALETQGVVLKIGDGGGPEVFEAIGEVTDFDGPGGSANVIDAGRDMGPRRSKMSIGAW